MQHETQFAEQVLAERYGDVAVWRKEDGPQAHAEWAEWSVNWYVQDDNGIPRLRSVDFTEHADAESFAALMVECGRTNFARVIRVSRGREERDGYAETEDRINRREFEIDTSAPGFAPSGV